MNRLLLYSTVHHGLRAELSAVAAELRRADLAVRETRVASLARLTRLLQFLAEHGEHEDRDVMPLVAQAHPLLAAELSDEHRSLEVALADLVAQARAIEAGNGDAAGLCASMDRFVERQFAHMRQEESEANAALWSGFDDTQLAAAHGRILASIAPPRLAEWVEMFLPALDEAAGAAFVADLRAKLPPQACDALMASARRKLGEAAWSRIDPAHASVGAAS